MSKKAQKQSYALVPETCPDIDKAWSVFEGIIKNKTGSLRDALTGAIEELHEAEKKIEDLENELYDAKSRIADLEAELAAKENQSA